jgi:hypothetical protein
MNNFVYGTLRDEPSAADTLKALENEHFDPRDISLFIWKGQGVQEIPVELKTGVCLGAAIGAVIGVAVGVLAAWTGVMDTSSFLGAVAIAYGGGAAGMILGGLAGLGYWKDAPKFPPDHYRHGEVVVGVSTTARADLAEDVLHRMGARDIRMQTKRGAIEELEHHTSAA